MSSKKRIAIFGNVYQEKKSKAIADIFHELSARGAELCVDTNFLDFLKSGGHTDLPPCTTIDNDDFTADMVISMGGDGTFLNVASRVGDKDIPILGINTGRLGFLSSISGDDIANTIDNLYAGNYSVNSHSVLQATCDEEPLRGYPFALNEVALLKHDSSSMISIATRIDGQYLTVYQADGLLVSTPTGSTAYSLSVGGPIIHPRSETILLTPVAPHSLNMRPLVLCDDVEIELVVTSRSHNFLVSIDGRSHSYREKIHIRIRKAPYTIKAVTMEGTDFFSTIRRKMMWGADSRI